VKRLVAECSIPTTIDVGGGLALINGLLSRLERCFEMPSQGCCSCITNIEAYCYVESSQSFTIGFPKFGDGSSDQKSGLLVTRYRLG
jgi:hypothetical protein